MTYGQNCDVCGSQFVGPNGKCAECELRLRGGQNLVDQYHAAHDSLGYDRSVVNSHVDIDRQFDIDWTQPDSLLPDYGAYLQPRLS